MKGVYKNFMNLKYLILAIIILLILSIIIAFIKLDLKAVVAEYNLPWNKSNKNIFDKDKFVIAYGYFVVQRMIYLRILI